MSTFTSEHALRSRWSPGTRQRAVRWFAALGVLALIAAVVLGIVASRLSGIACSLAVLATVAAAAGAIGCFASAIVIRFAELVGRLLSRFAFLIFLGAVVGIVVVAWVPALLYGVVDAIGPPGTLTVQQIQSGLESGNAFASSAAHLGGAYWLWPLQFRLTRDILAMVGAIGFVCIFASFSIWWERKVAGRIQSRLGPMRVGGWHGWAQSVADGLKLFQKEDICLEGADRKLFFLAPYIVFVPALTVFLALPFSAAWVGRDLDVGLILIFAMLGIGVVGVLLGGWASNDKWSMFGAMREACQMISYEIPLGFALLVPVMIAGTLRLTAIGDMQSGGFWTWLAFSNPFAFAAAVIFFIATLASCKRAPFDLPEAESELVAGYMTEYSGFRWALFMFAEYAEMFAVSALASILFFGAWNSPLPASWGAGWAHGTLWHQALHGLLFSGPLWLIGKGFFFVFVQIWLRWTLPRIRIDQVMFACIQVLLPLALLVLLGNTIWGWLLAGGSTPVLVFKVVFNVLFSAVGVILAAGFAWFVAYGFTHRRALVGTLAIDHLPGA
jgi:NADH-quinone oxidoreductase subunit H